ncbi:MAG TPA: type II toxin-antitoxin system PemK/MazF family toxin [Phycisphaerae bacterium]|jgi:mRNA-degrading endonuclease toxin of MazEF toxin-antitoxin module|nr:type II toxin-antitoxin system PemK/MazF family toxin [Phycisphaerae bacterium]
MKASKPLRIGDIYWLADCEPLQGHHAKTRPVVVLTPPEAEAAIGGIIAVACTSSSYPSNVKAIELPSHPEGKVRSGLRKKTWAVPEWTIMVRRERLKRYSGYISGALLDRIVQAFEAEYRKDHQA